MSLNQLLNLEVMSFFRNLLNYKVFKKYCLLSLLMKRSSRLCRPDQTLDFL